MSPAGCECGYPLIKCHTTKIIGTARRRQYQCISCGEWFATIEQRVPPNMDIAVFQSTVRYILRKAEKNGKVKGSGENPGVQQVGAEAPR